MKLRVVAIPMIAAICLGSPAIARSNTDEQQTRRGARDRSGDNNGRRAESRGGGDDNRTASRRDDGEQRRTQNRDQDRGRDRNRTQDRNRDRDRDRPVIITRTRPNINVNIGSYRGPRYYAPWSGFYGALGYSSYGYYGPGFSPYAYGNYGYGYGYNYAGPGTYSPWRSSGYDVGGIRLRIRPRDAQVFVDGYYAGLVDDFDGTFQSLRLEQGGHKIEIHMQGFEDLELDVHVQSGKTITLNEELRPRP